MSKEKAPIEERIGEIATNENGEDGVIKWFDEEKDRVVGHQLDDEGVYWQAYKPKFTGIDFIDFDEKNKEIAHEDKK